MSVPFGLTISYDAENKTFTIVDLSRAAVLDLYDYLEPLFEETWPYTPNSDKDYAGRFVGCFIGGVMPFYHLPAAEYRQACQWVAEAVDKLESLKPYKSDLIAALQADPRYKAV
ncbi:glycine cleavage system H protein [Neisseria montereyensis]|uniref:Glycine cleavage system H protein n=1 Tax=Neisseria montereyensis TaxID=2973938 RepID=A0ABT2FA22_9NEIS|nr:glycine cleavage system H protein [Neisseria montereyensis]MCS4533053.1 glycine cleavage system H protein [Neisseria montereyensis]